MRLWHRSHRVAAADLLVELDGPRLGARVERVLERARAVEVLTERQVLLALACVAAHELAVGRLAEGLDGHDLARDVEAGAVVVGRAIQVAEALEHPDVAALQ